MPVAPSPANQRPEFSFRTRQKDWDRLKQNPDQLLEIAIVGGGIVGAGLLRELTLRGVSNVWLFEKNDFASGTSSASSKLVHAGIRYLEQVWLHLKKARLKQAVTNFNFVFDASRERRILGRVAPRLVRPKPIYFVLGKSDPRSNLSVLSGVWLYYVIQLLQGQFFSAPIAAFRESAIRNVAPELDASRIKSVFRFWDSETDDARLVMVNLQDAHGRGAAALNYVEMVDYERIGKHVRLTLKNRENDEVAVVTTKRLINASGAHLDDVRAREKNVAPEARKWIDRVAGSHIDVYPKIADRSYYISAGDNRLVFALLRDEDGLLYTRIGTTERALDPSESSDRPEPSKGELDYLKRLVKDYFPGVTLNDATILKTDAGIRPLRSQAELSAFDKSREHDVIDEGGVFHVAGVKLTDFRRVSSEIADKLGVRKTVDSTNVPLVPSSQRTIYPFQSVSDVVRETMPLHWGDYVWRRWGAKPAFELRHDPALAKNEFENFAGLMGWSEPKRSEEWKNAL